MSTRQRLIAGGVWVTLGKAATVTTSLLVNVLLSRLLAPGELGVYFLAYSMALIGASVAGFGQPQAVVRFVAEARGRDAPARARAAVSATFRLVFVGVALVAATTLLAGPTLLREVFDKPRLAGATGLLAGWITVQGLLFLTGEAFRGFEDMRRAALYGGVVSGLLSVLALGVVRLRTGTATLETALWISILSLSVSLALGMVALVRRVGALPGGERLSSRVVLAVSFPLWLHRMTVFALLQSDIWILGALRPAEELAIYGAAARIVALVVMPLMLVNLVVLPMIAELDARGRREGLERMLRRTAGAAGAPAFGVLLAFLLFGGPILGLVFGDYYRDGAWILALLSLGRIVAVWTGSCGAALSMTGNQGVLLGITATSAVLTVGAALVAVRSHGGVGVAAAVAAGSALQNLWLWLAARGRLGVWTHVAVPRLSDLRLLMPWRGRRAPGGAPPD